MNLILVAQTALADILRPLLVQFRAEIEKRFPIWEKLSREQRLAWIARAADDDPLFALFVEVVKYARKWRLDDE